jgi:hypothetical protein
MMEPDISFLDFCLLLAAGVGLFLFVIGPLLVVGRLQNVPLIFAALCFVPVIGVPLYILRIVSGSSRLVAEKVK